MSTAKWAGALPVHMPSTSSRQAESRRCMADPRVGALRTLHTRGTGGKQVPRSLVSAVPFSPTGLARPVPVRVVRGSHTVADLRRPLHPCVLSDRDPRTSNRRGPKAGSLHRRLYFGTALQA